jgi:hypothetical protein
MSQHHNQTGQGGNGSDQQGAQQSGSLDQQQEINTQRSQQGDENFLEGDNDQFSDPSRGDEEGMQPAAGSSMGQGRS